MWLCFLLKHFHVRSLLRRFFHFGRLSVLFYARRAFGASVCVIFNFLFLNEKKLKCDIRSYANLKRNEIIIAMLRISILKKVLTIQAPLAGSKLPGAQNSLFLPVLSGDTQAPSTLIRFQAKTEPYCSGYGYRPHYNAENDHRKRSHSKTLFSRVDCENDAI